VQTKYDIQIAIPDLKAAHSSAMHVPSLNYTRNAFDTGVVIIDIAWYLDLQLPIQLVQITTDVVSSGDVYSIQHYVIKFVSYLLQILGFLRVPQFLPPVKLTATI